MRSGGHFHAVISFRAVLLKHAGTNQLARHACDSGRPGDAVAYCASRHRCETQSGRGVVFSLSGEEREGVVFSLSKSIACQEKKEKKNELNLARKERSSQGMMKERCTVASGEEKKRGMEKRWKERGDERRREEYLW